MKKILVVFTGGTIGCSAENNVLHTDPHTTEKMLADYIAQTDCPVQFDTVQPLNILSENVHPSHWKTLRDQIAALDLDVYSGIVITHGSDTLAYTTALFSYLLSGISIPVVFTASNYSLSDVRSNGKANFSASVDFILNANIPGIFCIYQSHDGTLPVYLGTRMHSASSYTDEFSAHGIPFGTMHNRMFERYCHEQNPTSEQLRAHVRADFTPAPFDAKFSILHLQPYPDLNYSMLCFDKQKPAAILHGLYHSSTACIEPDSHSLLQFAKRCAAENIALYLYDCHHIAHGHLYDTSNALTQTGAVLLSGLSPEAAFTKLYAAYHQTVCSPVDYMQHTQFFECVTIE